MRLDRFGSVMLVTAIVSLAGCKSSDLQPEPPAPPPSGDAPPTSSRAFFDDDGAATQLLDATSNDDWVYFDLDTFSVVSPVDSLNDPTWDIAVQRFKIKVNGGVSGSGGVTVSVLQDTPLLQADPALAVARVPDRSLAVLTDEELLRLGDNLFFSVCAPEFDNDESPEYCLANDQVRRDRLDPNTAAFAFLTLGSGVVIGGSSATPEPILGWYDYFPSENHLLRPSGDTWVINSTEGIDFGLEMVGYYGIVEGDAESGNVAFRYMSMTPGFDVPPPGAQQLIASMSASVLTGEAPLSVDFTGSADGISGSVSYDWDFGDGGIGTGPTVSYIFDTPGVYDVTFRAIDDRGPAGAAVQTLSISVVEPDPGPPPVADAGADQIINLDTRGGQTEVALDGSGSTDADANIVSYVWTGSPDPADEVSPSVVLGAGSYTFSLTVTDASDQSDSDTVTITVNDPANQIPMAVAGADVISGAAPLTVNFDASSSNDPDGTLTSYEWTFADGSGATAFGETASYTFERAGLYAVQLSVMDADGAIATDIIEIAVSASHLATQDTYIYEFLGTQADATGDSRGLSVWNHQSIHGGKGLIGFDNAVVADAASAATSGSWRATLYLYSTCVIGGFVRGCPGNPDADNPYTPGTATVITDIFLQGVEWNETMDVPWASINEGPATPFATLTQSESNRWYGVDVTDLVAEWVANGNTGFGFSLSQELYPVIRDDAFSIAVTRFCDSESSTDDCDAETLGFDPRPYIEITVTP
ncbi:MAG: PKD domain-containing protein [Pseudomonadota bacterium]